MWQSHAVAGQGRGRRAARYEPSYRFPKTSGMKWQRRTVPSP